MQDYKKLQEQFSKYIFDYAEDEEIPIYSLQKKNRDKLLNLIAKIMLTYTITDTVLSLGDREKTTLRGNFIDVIASMVKAEFDNEKNLMNNILTDVTKDKYYSDAYTFQIDFGFKLKKLTDEQISQVVDESIKGEIWSDRLWSNKKALETTLKQETERFLQGDTDVNKIKKVIEDRFNQNAYNSSRLVRTEVAKCQSAGNDLFAKEHGVEWQMYSATLDTHTCDICASDDGKKFRVDDESKPALPRHPLDRCCYINLPSADWTPNKRKDNETKEIIDFKSYSEWKQEQNI